jgi:hypothetical protein
VHPSWDSATHLLLAQKVARSMHPRIRSLDNTKGMRLTAKFKVEIGMEPLFIARSVVLELRLGGMSGTPQFFFGRLTVPYLARREFENTLTPVSC